MDSEPQPSGSSPSESDLERIEARLARLEQALLNAGGGDADSAEEALAQRIDSLSSDADDAREPVEKLHEVADLARDCARAIDHLELRIVKLEEAGGDRRAGLERRVSELREQVYQALRTVQESRQSEAQQELASTLATLLENHRGSLPKPSVN